MIELLFDMIIDERPLAIGQRVALSEMSENLLVRKGMAKKVIDDPIIDFVHSGGGQLPDVDGGKKRAKGGKQRGRHADSPKARRSGKTR